MEKCHWRSGKSVEAVVDKKHQLLGNWQVESETIKEVGVQRKEGGGVTVKGTWEEGTKDA